MEKRELVCICCPLGCNLEVTIEEHAVLKITGNSCRKGEEYGKKECINPTRIVTSILPVLNGDLEMLPVKTDKDIPKALIKECLKALKNIKVEAPVTVGKVLLPNILGTDANIIATREVKKI